MPRARRRRARGRRRCGEQAPGRLPTALDSRRRGASSAGTGSPRPGGQGARPASRAAAGSSGSGRRGPGASQSARRRRHRRRRAQLQRPGHRGGSGRARRTRRQRRQHHAPGPAIVSVARVEPDEQVVEPALEPPAHGAGRDALLARHLRRREPLPVTEQHRRPVGLLQLRHLLGHQPRASCWVSSSSGWATSGRLCRQPPDPRRPPPRAARPVAHEIAQHLRQPGPRRPIAVGGRPQRRDEGVLNQVLGGRRRLDQPRRQPLQPGGVRQQVLGSDGGILGCHVLPTPQHARRWRRAHPIASSPGARLPMMPKGRHEGEDRYTTAGEAWRQAHVRLVHAFADRAGHAGM